MHRWLTSLISEPLCIEPPYEMLEVSGSNCLSPSLQLQRVL